MTRGHGVSSLHGRAHDLWWLFHHVRGHSLWLEGNTHPIVFMAAAAAAAVLHMYYPPAPPVHGHHHLRLIYNGKASPTRPVFP